MNALRRLVSALRSPGAAAPDGMSVAQHFALRIIGRQPGITMSDLAEATLTTRSAISEVVSRLYARGLLKRSTDPQDSRRIHLQLTPEGERVWKTVGDAMPERLVAALLAMSLESRAQLASSLEEWVAEAHLTGVSPSMFGEHEHHAEKDLPVATE
jgi:DNA-binding MarR family transcriptional regulator